MVNSETVGLLHCLWTDYSHPQSSEFIDEFMNEMDVGYHKLFLSDGADAFCRSLGAQCNAFQKEDMEEYGLGTASFWSNGHCEATGRGCPVTVSATRYSRILRPALEERQS